MDPRFATTFQSGFACPGFERIAKRIAVPERLDRLPREPFRPSDELVLLWRVLAAAREHDSLLLFSSRGYLKPELTACLLLGLLPRRRRPKLIVYGEMFQPSQGFLGVLERTFMNLLKNVVDRFIVFSEAERREFSQAWSIPLENIRSCLAFVPRDEHEEHLLAALDAEDEQRVLHRLDVAGRRYVFAGGSSFRDYAPLVEAARQLPETPFVIASRDLEYREDLPGNVRHARLDRSTYRALLRNADAVVVPLQVDVTRASGLFTYLRSMAMGKPTIVSNSLATDEYVEHGRTGWIVEPTADAYAATIRYVLDPSSRERVEQVTSNARARVREHFTLEAYVGRLLSEIQDLRRSPEAVEVIG